MSLMVLTLFLPGSAQMIAGNRRVGWVALRIWGAVVGLGLIAAVMSLADHETGFTLLANTSLLLFVRLLLMVGAIAWVALFMTRGGWASRSRCSSASAWRSSGSTAS
jgi:hypothetical protein